MNANKINADADVAVEYFNALARRGMPFNAALTLTSAYATCPRIIERTLVESELSEHPAVTPPA